MLCNTAELMDGAPHDDYGSTVSPPFVLDHDSRWVVGLDSYPLDATRFSTRIVFPSDFISDT